MVRHIPIEDLRERFDEIAGGVRETGDPVIVEDHGQPIVVLVSIQDFEAMEDARRKRAAAELTRLGQQVALERQGPGPTEEEIVEALRRTREELYRERYGNS